MHKKLILSAYKKAKETRKKLGDYKPSSVKISEDLSDYIDEITNLKLNEKTFRVYYAEAKKITEEKVDINISQLRVVYGLCKYLGFESYEEFVSDIHQFDNIKIVSKTKTTNKKSIDWIKNNKIATLFLLLFIVFFTVKLTEKEQRWMVWQDDHYVEVELDLKKYELSQMKKYNQHLIRNFKKINSPDCTTIYKTKEGKTKIWYWKKNNEKIELFTALALHPTNGKTLKPITKYMIQKYICSD
jgi:hypothetical protein